MFQISTAEASTADEPEDVFMHEILNVTQVGMHLKLRQGDSRAKVSIRSRFVLMRVIYI